MSDSADITPEDRAAIVDVIHRSRIAIWMHDFEAYATCFVHADYLTRWNASRQAEIFRREGWDDIAARVQRAFKDETLRIAGYAFDARVENLKLRISGDMAWATFDQIYPSINMDHHYYPGGASHEVRVFERQDGRWLIAFLGVMHGSVGRYDTPILHVTPDGEVTWQSPAAAAALAEAAVTMTELKGATTYARKGIVEKAGWATPLGADKPNTDLAQACQLKLAEAF